MTVNFRYFPNEPIIVAEFDLPFSGTDVETANEKTAQLAQQMNRPVVRIEHVIGNLDFADVTEGLSAAARSNAAGSARDPNVTFLFVGSGPIIEMTAKAFAQAQYAGREVRLFASADEALAHARQIVAG